MTEEPATNAAPTVEPTEEPKPETPLAVETPIPEAVSEPTAEPTEPTHASDEVIAESLVQVPEASTEATTADQQDSTTATPVEPEIAAEPISGEGGEPAEPTAPAAKPKRTRTKKAATTTDPSTPSTAVATTEPAAVAAESKKKWYAIKVQSGREESIKAAIMRKVAIEGLEEFVGQIVIPVEEVVEKKQVKVKDKKTGESTYQEKKVTRKKKKFHGYLFAELEFNDRILYLFRETSGVGDFLNMRGKPPVPEPMPEHEVQSMLTGVSVKDPTKKPTKVKLDFEKGDRVKIREGPFANSEGEVKIITEPKDPTESPKVTVVVTLWGRPVDVELEYWQVDKL